MDIYEPAEDSYLLQKVVQEHAIGRVLDVGTGSGIQALTAIKNKNVHEVIAVDINESALEKLNEQIKTKHLRKIKTLKSDLFENVHGCFYTIIFNPPYLPQDKGIEDPALYGGKKGWEISQRFFKDVSKSLFNDGKILFLFSTLTNKEKIDDIIIKNLLEFEQVASQKIAFEELFVYVITKKEVRKKLEAHNIDNITYLTQGKRGMIFTGIMDKSKFVKTHLTSKKNEIKVGIKIQKDDIAANRVAQDEAMWLKELNQHNIGPRYLLSGENFVVYEFVEGQLFFDWIKDKPKNTIRTALINLLNQCNTMDRLRVNKEELHHPYKHIVVTKGNVPIMIDFERCHRSDKPHNVTQFIEFLARVKETIGFSYDISTLRELAKEYKDTYSKEVFAQIKQLI